MIDRRVTVAVANAIAEDFEGPPTAEEEPLLAEATQKANGIEWHRRPLMALSVTPEQGVEVLTRGELAARLRAIGLEREAVAVFRIGRGDVERIVCWSEGEDTDGAAIARLGCLKSPTAKVGKRR